MSFRATLWVTNDFPHDIEGSEVSWQIVGIEDGEIVMKNAFRATLPADSVEELDRMDWEIPATVRPGAYRVAMQVLGPGGQTLSANANHRSVTPPQDPLRPIRA